ncbi:4Fe-4S single cluster domain-containing protein [Streptomyces sp. RKAG293]|uniref:4Fe-4S single cluster domain-containing protein n=1 Tax=Streptomyces sp. RKAG293 TaxID=2893403 RepID=UPI0020345C24|nr:4Fe-4S single cluster domain-containing protein [Streptomyces sp. RKAG293]MCM2422618.1 radical SAM protein [Streptomyces sp. RKAG293]
MIFEDESVYPDLRVSRTLEQCGVLGPGQRAVVWVQGCPLRCPGCLAQETLAFSGGEVRSVPELADWLVGLASVQGVTFSGGEPFSQARGLADLLDSVRARRPDFSAMAYSGFRLEALRRGTEGQRSLLERLDLLVDGSYQAARQGNIRWRGSANQRLLALTERYAEWTRLPDIGAGIEASLDRDGTLTWSGVPPTAGFREQIETSLAESGYVVGTVSGEPSVDEQGEQ